MSTSKSGGKLYLIRHGEVAWNRENSYIGSTDLPLNDDGRRQAGLLADRLKGIEFDAVYSSDLSRARETAEIIAERLGLSVVIVPALRELDYGDWEGMPEVELPKRYPQLFAEWRANPADVRTPNGETFGELRDRACSALHRIAEAHSDGNAIVVAHKSANRVILCCLMGIDINHYREIGQGNAALNVIERRSDGRMVVESANDTSHLSPG